MKYDIYLCGSCSSEDRTRMVGVAKYLREKGKKVYCPWELHIENAWDMPQEEWAHKVFDADIAAINDSVMLLYISKGRVSTAGSNWEQGYAFGRGIPVHVVQLTNEPTSLMTYWGCNNFNNLNQYHSLEDELRWIVENAPQDYHGKCRTVLT